MNAILIDDEPLALDYLERQINKVSNLSILGKYIYFDIHNNLNIVKDSDLVFLDIEMPEINGLELAEQLLEINPALTVIFVTAYKDYAVNAFELNALDYILKPVEPDRLQKALNKLENKHDSVGSTNLSLNNKLRVNVCNELTFQFPEDNMMVAQWRITKAKELFLYLLLHNQKVVRKSELVEVLWPELDNNAYSQLYTAIYHVRKTLNPFRDHLSIKNVTEGYILTVQNTIIDVVEWENKIVSAPSIDINTVAYYEDTMNLYTGSYLQEHDYLWVEPERYRLEQLWIKTAYRLATFYYEQKDWENAEKWYQAICTLRPDDENAHFSLMKIYADLGLGLLVNHQYILLKKSIKELSLTLSPNIKKWYEQWNKKRKTLKI
ncbi:response regulator [Ornithinibacillus halotolerans]|uniref:Response regulatory domain-containing protein n=1 Tax=Ornithinibacillus halotolerans TaxID=1274357 RepID=A0A916RUP4_9BACI|nr:response regulator [Ornithinibacillus halotolerans]GGA70623.1 hypothetical protein GCM10008025_13070 [Ornithinibacillus halotolerans]